MKHSNRILNTVALSLLVSGMIVFNCNTVDANAKVTGNTYQSGNRGSGKSHGSDTSTGSWTYSTYSQPLNWTTGPGTKHLEISKGLKTLLGRNAIRQQNNYIII